MPGLRRLLLALALIAGAPVLAPVWMPLATPAWAVRPDEMLSDPRLEARARALSRELRCMVCQNQSIDDSEAPLAHDLRVLVRERLVAGDSDQQVLDFLVARYGEFVLLKPPLSWHTALLWLGPPALLFGGGLALVLFARRRASAGLDTEPLSAAEQARLAELTQPQGQ
jgi:cytochrome c-type biogenesis protein CcmH